MLASVIVAAVCGYVGAIYSWDKVKVWVNGAETEIRSLEDKLKALKAKL